MTEPVNAEAASAIGDSRRLFKHVKNLNHDAKWRDSLSNIYSVCASAERWQALMASIPIDEWSFQLETGARRTDVIAALKEWCTTFEGSKRDNRYAVQQINTFGYLSILLITLITMEENALSTTGPISESSPAVLANTPFGSSSPTAGHADCSDVCGKLIRDTSVQQALLSLYALPIGDCHLKDELLDVARERSTSDSSGEENEEASGTEIDLSSLYFHRHGSTSFILRGYPPDLSRGRRTEFALKCVLFPYSNIPIIASKTASYVLDHNAIGNAKHMVYVWASTTRWILMDFAEGQTLAEEIERLARPDDTTSTSFQVKGDALLPGRRVNWKTAVSAAGNVRLDFIRRLSLPLLDALRELQLQGKHHGDLSPSNVIVQGDSTEEYTIKFIDFGQNYLYNQSVGGLEGPDGAFVAPEVRNNENNIGSGADLYSFGRILIALGNVGENKDGTVPDRFYGQAPLIARLIEDLIDNKPEQRLLVFKVATDDQHTYESLHVALKQELDAAQAALVADPEERPHAIPYNGRSFWGSIDLLYPLSREPQKRWRIYKIRRDQKILSDARRSMYARWLLTFSVLASVNFYVTAFVSVHWFMRDIGIDISTPVTTLIVRILGHNFDIIALIDKLREPDYKIGQVAHNLPARLIGLSFALAAVRYYQNIFGDLTTRVAKPLTPRGTLDQFWTELTIRTMSIWSSWLILSANLIQVRWWPICTAIGYTGCLLANVSSARFATRYLDVARRRGLGTVPQAHQKIAGLDGFRQWGPSMALYSLVVWVVGALIYFGILKDVYVYAILVAVINIVLFYISKTGTNALDVRTGLNRCFLAAERLKYVDDRRLGNQRKAIIEESANRNELVGRTVVISSTGSDPMGTNEDSST